jgi:hypothetical protein
MVRGGTMIDPRDDEKVNEEVATEGVHVAVNIPSPAARSGTIPSSCKVITAPLEVVTVTGPAGEPQLILSAERVTGTPTSNVDG